MDYVSLYRCPHCGTRWSGYLAPDLRLCRNCGSYFEVILEDCTQPPRS
jgi:rRNA maturation protein Nop10